MAYCMECGARLPEGARFCPNCGAPAAAAMAPPPPAAPSATPLSPPPEGPDEERGGFGSKALAALAVLAALIVAFVVWQQRDGARPVAGNDSAIALPTPTPSDTAVPEPVESTPTPEPTPSDTAGEDLPAAAPKADTIVPVRTLDRAFATEPRFAGQEIVGPLRLRGDVTTVNPDDDRPSVGLEGDGGDVIAYFDDDQRDAVALLDGGSAVKITCARARHRRGITVLEGCRL